MTEIMNFEQWLYRRDREEFTLCFCGIDIARHLCRQAVAEQEIERILRA